MQALLRCSEPEKERELVSEGRGVPAQYAGLNLSHFHPGILPLPFTEVPKFFTELFSL